MLSISLLHKLRSAKYVWFGCLHASMHLDTVLPFTLKQKTTDVWVSKKRSVIWHCRFCITRHCPSFALVLSLQQHYQALILIRNSIRLETNYTGSITYVMCVGYFSTAYFTDNTSKYFFKIVCLFRWSIFLITKEIKTAVLGIGQMLSQSVEAE